MRGKSYAKKSRINTFMQASKTASASCLFLLVYCNFFLCERDILWVIHVFSNVLSYNGEGCSLTKSHISLYRCGGQGQQLWLSVRLQRLLLALWLWQELCLEAAGKKTRTRSDCCSWSAWTSVIIISQKKCALWLNFICKLDLHKPRVRGWKLTLNTFLRACPPPSVEPTDY